MKSGQYGVFDAQTCRSRIRQAKQVLTDNGLAACVSIAPEHHFYFGGYDSWVGVNSPQAMIFTDGDDEPTLLLRDVDLPLATETTWLNDIRTYHLHSESFPEIVAAILQDKGVSGSRIGIEMQSYALSYSLGLQLAEALAPAELSDATNLLGALRLIKSPEELAFIREAGTMADAGLRALNESCRPGVSETELAHRIEHAVRSAGSDYWAIPVELSSGNRSAGCHGTPRRRTLEAGDLVHAEFAGVRHRYHAVGIQTIACGETGQREKELYALGKKSLEAGVAAIGFGVSVADVEQASLEPLVREGLEHTAMMRFGYGIGIAYPPIWLETLQISRDFDTRLQPGMAFVLHSCLELPDEDLGVILGGTYVLEQDGLSMVAGAGEIPLG